ncbi:basic proline-rich protein-like [Microtus oregoni]|uniref:basic proline-rich protein-like n=1 Tax=Microtus oregoni TaxID=111838 RepID=UPI001BB18996|nr:basic proline-rich protein-like [Microtus oregoni]
MRTGPHRGSQMGAPRASAHFWKQTFWEKPPPGVPPPLSAPKNALPELRGSAAGAPTTVRPPARVGAKLRLSGPRPPVSDRDADPRRPRHGGRAIVSAVPPSTTRGPGRGDGRGPGAPLPAAVRLHRPGRGLNERQGRRGLCASASGPRRRGAPDGAAPCPPPTAAGAGTPTHTAAPGGRAHLRRGARERRGRPLLVRAGTVQARGPCAGGRRPAGGLLGQKVLAAAVAPSPPPPTAAPPDAPPPAAPVTPPRARACAQARL